MRGVVCIGGEGPGPEALCKIVRGADLLVAADSGLVALEDAGLRPDWVIGDMDSLDDLSRLEKYPPDRVRRFPPDKDFTDTELALALLREKGCNEAWIAGGGGGRMAHLFAIHALFKREESPDRWFPGIEEIRCLKEGNAFGAALPCESLVSVFPLGTGPWEAESSGLKWPLDGLSWEEGSFGVSNLATTGVIKIRSIRGRFLIFIPMVFGEANENTCNGTSA